jgi:hypothetical protein
MDNRINEIRRKINILRTEMTPVEDAMHHQIRRDLDSTESASRLIAKRIQLAALVTEWRAAGGSNPLPSVSDRLKASHRPTTRPNTAAQRRS